MAYPEPPEPPPAVEPSGTRIRPDVVQLWAGGFATAIVAALIALVGILVCRWTLGIPILAPSSAGAWGSAHTGEYVLAAGLIALAATGLLNLLMLGAPQPGLFFRWIMGLATVVAVVYPFSTGAPLDQKAATAIVDLILGIAITSLLTAVGARATRRVYRRPPRDGTYRDGPYADGAYREGTYRDDAHREGGYRRDDSGDGRHRERPADVTRPYPPGGPYEGPRNVRPN